MPPYDESTLGLGVNDPAYLDLVQKQQEALSRANQPYGMNAGQGAIAAGLGLLPALIGGLVKGKEGLNAGLQAGMGGVGLYDKTLENNFQRASENEKANAALYGAQANQVLQNELGFNKFLRQEEIKQNNRKEIKDIYGNGGTTINNIMPGSLDKQTRKDVDPHLDMYQSMSQSIKAGENILKENPQFANMNYDNPSETLKTLGTGAEAWLKGGSTAFGEFRNTAQIAASDWLVATSGLAVTEPEFQRKFKALTGDGAVFATPKTTLHFLNNIRQRSKQNALMEAAKGVMATGKATTLDEAVASPQYKKTKELMDGIEKGTFGSNDYNVFNREAQTFTGPKGAFTVGTK